MLFVSHRTIIGSRRQGRKNSPRNCELFSGSHSLLMTHEAKNACLFICMSGSGKARKHTSDCQDTSRDQRVQSPRKGLGSWAWFWGSRSQQASHFSNGWVPTSWLPHETANITDKKMPPWRQNSILGRLGWEGVGWWLITTYDNQGLQSHLFQFTHKMWLSTGPKVLSSDFFTV